MRRVCCPYCNNCNVIDATEWGQLVQCEAPRCRRPYLATTERPQNDPPPAPTPQEPLPPRLTGPHVCLDCRGQILQALNRRRATIVHRRPAHGDHPAGTPCRMDVYAAIYFCPNALCGSLLETPISQWGLPVTCPECLTLFDAPRDDLLHEHQGDAREGQVFRFACPACSALLRCDSTLNGLPMAGKRVVCLTCRHLIEVPPGGAAVGAPASPRPGPREAVQQGPTRRCGNPACGNLVPSRAGRCPVCNTEQPAYGD